MKKVMTIAAFVLIVLAPVAALSEEMILESQSNIGLQKCDNLHHVETCDNYHVKKVPETLGQTLNLDGQEYTVNWIGLGYYFEGGLILQATEDGQWFEVAPRKGQLHTASWTDVDASGALSISDSLVIDGQELKIKDVRMQVRVSPILK